MNFINMALRSMGNAATALANLGAAIEDNTLGRRRRRARANPSDDVEMDTMTGSGTTSTRTIPAVPEQRFPSLREFGSDPTRYVIRRPRLFRDLKEVARTVIILLAITLFTTSIWPNFVFTVKWLAGYNETMSDDPIHQIRVFAEYVSPQATHHAQAITTLPTSPVYVPDFYMVHRDEGSSNGIWQTVSTQTETATSSSVYHVPSLGVEDFSTVHKQTSELNRRDETQPVHYAYPLHAGKIVDIEQAKKVKTQLKRCTEVLDARLKGQALDTTPAFEFALHNCNSSISHALDTLFPGRLAPARIYISKRAADVSGAATDQTNASVSAPDSEQTECNWKRPTSRLLGRSCSKDFCGWVSTTNLDRCYHKNETIFKQSGKKVFVNETVDDFKDDAPLECNLCLPRRDCDGIDDHCESVETIAKDVITGLVIGCLLVFVLLGIGLLIYYLHLRWRRARGPAVIEGIELEDRSARDAAPPPAE